MSGTRTAEACLFVLTESRRGRKQGLRMLEQVAARAPELKTTLFDPELPASGISRGGRAGAGWV